MKTIELPLSKKEIQFKNEQGIIDIFIRFIDEHRKITDQKGIIERKRILNILISQLKKEELIEGEIYKIKIINAKDSVDKLDVYIPVKVTKILKRKIRCAF